MQKKESGFVPQVDFKEQTPDMLLKTESQIRFMKRLSFPERIRAKQNMLKIRQPGTNTKN